MRCGPSQLAENLSSFFLALLAILHTKSPMANDRGHRFALYFLAARCFAAKLRIWAFSLSSGRRSRCMTMFWWLWVGRGVCQNGSHVEDVCGRIEGGSGIERKRNGHLYG